MNISENVGRKTDWALHKHVHQIGLIGNNLFNLYLPTCAERTILTRLRSSPSFFLSCIVPLARRPDAIVVKFNSSQIPKPSRL